MVCNDIGDSNPDISGLGIIISFAFQAGISLIVSIWSSLLGVTVITPYLDGSYLNTSDMAASSGSDLDSLVLAAASKKIDSIPAIKGRTGTFRVVWQRYRAFASPKSQAVASALEGLSQRDERICRRRLQKRVLDGILATISDLQTINALGLLIAGLLQSTTLSLYHLHIIYDTVNFTGMSVCASAVNVLALERGVRWSRFIFLVMLAVTYFTFLVFFSRALGDWDDHVTGRCYNTKYISSPGDEHPKVDRLYLVLTSCYFLVSLLLCVNYHIVLSSYYVGLVSRIGSSRWVRRYRGWSWIPTGYICSVLQAIPPEAAPLIVLMAMLQYPVHLYMVIAMRTANESLLSGEREETWGFGQIVSLVLSLTAFLEFTRGVAEYVKLGRQEQSRRGDREEFGSPQRETTRRNSWSGVLRIDV